jgi:DUF4097 and DUF4098 domain-containing protein YvlB
MKAKWIVSSILIVALIGLAVLIAYTVIAGASLFNGRGFRVEVNASVAFKAEDQYQQRLEVSDAASLVVRNSAGDITVTGGGVGEVLVEAHKTAYGDSQAEADADLAALDVQISQEGNAVTVSVAKPETVLCMGMCRPDTVDFTLTVPEGTAVTVSTDSGDVAVAGTDGAADLSSSFGDIHVEQVAGALAARASSGRVTARAVQGGTVDLHSDFGDVGLSEARVGQVTLTTNSGGMTLTDVQASGAVTLQDDFGDIIFETGSSAALDVHAQSGKIRLSGLTVNGALTAHSDFGDVTVTGVDAGSYSLSSNSGAVTADGVHGRVWVQDDFGDILVRNAQEAVLDLNTNSGDVVFEGTLGEGPHTLHSDFGAVRLVLPAETALSFDLQTEFGSIASDIPVTVTGDVQEDHWVGTTNGGGIGLTASTNSGDIRIEILNP